MPVKSRLRQLLRDATQPAHAALDQSLSTLNLARPTDYARFLRIQLTALEALAGAWAATDAEDFDALRGHLRRDLGWTASASLPCPRAAVASRPAQWGLAYVIRGSRLGSKLLRARVGAGFATSYFDYLPATAWPQFLQELEQAGTGYDAAARLHVIEGANLAFAAYATAAASP